MNHIFNLNPTIKTDIGLLTYWMTTAERIDTRIAISPELNFMLFRLDITKSEFNSPTFDINNTIIPNLIHAPNWALDVETRISVVIPDGNIPLVDDYTLTQTGNLFKPTLNSTREIHQSEYPLISESKLDFGGFLIIRVRINPPPFYLKKSVIPEFAKSFLSVKIWDHSSKKYTIPDSFEDIFSRFGQTPSLLLTLISLYYMSDSKYMTYLFKSFNHVYSSIHGEQGLIKIFDNQFKTFAELMENEDSLGIDIEDNLDNSGVNINVIIDNNIITHSMDTSLYDPASYGLSMGLCDNYTEIDFLSRDISIPRTDPKELRPNRDFFCLAKFIANTKLVLNSGSAPIEQYTQVSETLKENILQKWNKISPKFKTIYGNSDIIYYEFFCTFLKKEYFNLQEVTGGHRHLVILDKSIPSIDAYKFIYAELFKEAEVNIPNRYFKAMESLPKVIYLTDGCFNNPRFNKIPLPNSRVIHSFLSTKTNNETTHILLDDSGTKVAGIQKAKKYIIDNYQRNERWCILQTENKLKMTALKHILGTRPNAILVSELPSIKSNSKTITEATEHIKYNTISFGITENDIKMVLRSTNLSTTLDNIPKDGVYVAFNKSNDYLIIQGNKIPLGLYRNALNFARFSNLINITTNQRLILVPEASYKKIKNMEDITTIDKLFQDDYFNETFPEIHIKYTISETRADHNILKTFLREVPFVPKLQNRVRSTLSLDKYQSLQMELDTYYYKMIDQLPPWIKPNLGVTSPTPNNPKQELIYTELSPIEQLIIAKTMTKTATSFVNNLSDYGEAVVNESLSGGHLYYNIFADYYKEMLRLNELQILTNITVEDINKKKDIIITRLTNEIESYLDRIDQMTK